MLSEWPYTRLACDMSQRQRVLSRKFSQMEVIVLQLGRRSCIKFAGDVLHVSTLFDAKLGADFLSPARSLLNDATRLNCLAAALVCVHLCDFRRVNRCNSLLYLIGRALLGWKVTLTVSRVIAVKRN